jgi:hypothetical protein
MAKNCVHILKLSVGTESVDDLAAWQASYRQRFADGLPRHVTRMWPRREDEVLNGGSVYWVIKGQIAARQRIRRLDAVQGDDGVTRCAIVLDPELIRTQIAPRRPFQGWRYLNPEDAPADLPQGRSGDDDLPPELAEALAEFGLR